MNAFITAQGFANIGMVTVMIGAVSNIVLDPIFIFGLNMGVKINPCAWFLNNAADVRSSFYMEDAASEFDVQGLELDWTVVVWDGDLIHQPGNTAQRWRYRNFSGTKWQEVRQAEDQRYRLNAYRVLLTRARQGMVIVVPEGDSQDPTRNPQFYDPTWDYLSLLGIPPASESRQFTPA